MLQVGVKQCILIISFSRPNDYVDFALPKSKTNFLKKKMVELFNRASIRNCPPESHRDERRIYLAIKTILLS